MLESYNHIYFLLYVTCSVVIRKKKIRTVYICYIEIYMREALGDLSVSHKFIRTGDISFQNKFVRIHVRDSNPLIQFLVDFI